MKNANMILNSIINSFPANRRQLARNVIECRYLASQTTQETALYLGVSYDAVVDVLQELKRITKGKKPIDFITA